MSISGPWHGAAHRRGRGFRTAAAGEFLERLGIEVRLRQLLDRATPAQREALENGCRRLLAPEAMGTLFKVLAMADPEGPVPPGFDKDERWR